MRGGIIQELGGGFLRNQQPYIWRSGSRTRIIGAANQFGDDKYRAKTLEAVSEVEV
jgi:hypothetical protein